MQDYDAKVEYIKVDETENVEDTVENENTESEVEKEEEKSLKRKNSVAQEDWTNVIKLQTNRKKEEQGSSLIKTKEKPNMFASKRKNDMYSSDWKMRCTSRCLLCSFVNFTDTVQLHVQQVGSYFYFH